MTNKPKSNPDDKPQKPRKSRRVKPLKAHLVETIEAIILFSELQPQEWICMAGEMCDLPIPQAKHGPLTRLFNLMDASERMHALTLMYMMKKGAVSTELINSAIRHGGLPAVTAVMVLE